jgi:hypothetical protein
LSLDRELSEEAERSRTPVFRLYTLELLPTALIKKHDDDIEMRSSTVVAYWPRGSLELPDQRLRTAQRVGSGAVRTLMLADKGATDRCSQPLAWNYCAPEGRIDEHATVISLIPSIA